MGSDRFERWIEQGSQVSRRKGYSNVDDMIDPLPSSRNSSMSDGVVANPSQPRRLRRPFVRPHLLWCAFLGLHGLLFPPPTYAYIDPGTGSYLVQVVIAGLLGILLSLKIYWARIKAFLKERSPFGRKDPAEHE